MKRVWVITLALALLPIFLAVNSAFAQTLGKITGTVRDASTGETLPGVNVVIEGISRGATTDADGVYIILAVDPGTVGLKASMIGYTSSTQSEVRIVAGYTTTVDFQIGEATLEMAEVVVVAERPPVEPDKTTSKHVVTAAEIEAVPMVRSSTALVALQPGMALDGGDRMRGSETGGAVGTVVGYMIDGIEVTRNSFGDVNTSAIQEVAVLSGGMGAEFGNALAGVVAVVTREGSQSFRGKVEYQLTPKGKRHWGGNMYDNVYYKDHMQWDDPDWVNETYADNGHPGLDGIAGTPDDDDKVHVKTDYTEHFGHRVEGDLSGPIGGSASFFASSTYSKGSNRMPWAEQTSLYNTRSVGSLTFRPSGNVKVKLGGMYESHKDFYTPNSAWAGAVKTTNTGATGRNIFIPEAWSASGKRKYTDDMFYLTLTHTLGTNTYYEARVYTVGSEADSYGGPTETEPIVTDKDGYFYLPRKIQAYNDSYNRRNGFKFNLSSQMNRAHLIQTGFEIRRYNYWLTYYREGTQPGYRVLDIVGKDYELGKGVTPWDFSAYLQDKLEYGGLIINAGVRFDYFNYGRNWRQAHGVEVSPMYTKFTYRQYELEHMEEGTPTFKSVSPRIGISHPITDKLAAHYFIGRFHSNLPMHLLYQMSYATQDPDRDVNGNGKIDATEMWNSMDALTSFAMGGGVHASEGMQPQKTTSVEMGVDWNIVSDYTTSMTGYYRLDEGLYGTNTIAYWKGPVFDTSQINNRRNTYWSSSRGLELSLRKDFSNNFSFRLSYDLSWQHGIGYGGSSPHYGRYSGQFYVIPDGNYVASTHYWDKWVPNPNGDGSEVPLRPSGDALQQLIASADANLESWKAREGTPAATGEYSPAFQVNDNGLFIVSSGFGSLPAPRNFGRRNQLSLQLFYATPADYGPRAGILHPFGGLNASVVYRLYSGNPFEYSPPVGPNEWRTESPSMRTDLLVRKDFPEIGRLQPALFVEVTNLFNEKNDEEGDFQFIQYGMKGLAPDNPDFTTYGDTSEWNRYIWDPRLIQVGLTLSF